MCVSVHKPQLFKIRYSMLLFVKKPQLCALSDGQAAALNLVLPPTIVTAQIDPLRSEGKSYANLLQQASVVVRYKNYEGVTYEFFGMAAVVDKAKEAQQFAAEGLKKAFK